jgi:hypothetical protein
MFPLLILLPVLLLVLAALGIFLLQQFRPSVGYAWLLSATAAAVVTAVVIFLRTRLPLQLSMDQWRLFDYGSTPPVFRLDYSSWPYVFALSVLALAFFLTDSARLETEARPYNWAAGMSISALALLAVMSGSPLTLVITWTAVDLVEFLMVMSTPAGRRMGQQTVTVFTIRVGSTLMVLLAVLFARSRGIPFDLAPIPAGLSIFMLLAVGLRLGVLPLNLPYTREVYAWRGLGHVLRMIGPASGLVVLGRMPAQAVPDEWRPVLLSLSALAAIYGGMMWLTADNELNGRPYWSISFAALAIASVINGNPQASIAWGTTLILSGSVLFFYSARRARNLVIPVLAAVGITGLPFFPTAAGWLGVTGQPPRFLNVIFLLSVILLILGFLRHILRPREELYRMERWIHTVYPAGLLALILANWGIGLFGWPGSRVVGAWWISASAALLTGVLVFLAVFFRQRFSADAIDSRWVGVFARQAGAALSDIFRLNWLYRFFAWVYQVVLSVIQLLTAILEGDGGILWSLVLLALLISLILTGGGVQ